jgi:DNA-binding transcriptional ArsR family regulator
VGRNRELAVVMRGLVDAEAGRGSSWVVLGPPGIGKSRLLRQIAEWATQRGFEVRSGYGLEGSLTPLLPFREIIWPPSLAASDERPGLEAAPAPPDGAARPRSTGRSRPTGDPRSFRAGANDLRTVGLRDRFATTPVDLAILGLIAELEEASRSRPQLVLLDDLQFSDADSLRCLRLLARRGRDRPIVVVVAARVDSRSWDHDPVGLALLDLRRSGLAQWLELGPLDEASLLQLLSRLDGRPVEELAASAPAHELVALAGGSPYFLIELSRTWPVLPARPDEGGGSMGGTDAGRSGPSDWLVQAPPEVRRAILDRLRSRPREERILLGLGARLGIEFDAEALAAATGRPATEVALRLRGLSREGWPIRAIGAGRPHFAFEHALLRDVVLAAHEFEVPRSTLARLVAWWARQRREDSLTEARLRQMVGDPAGAVGCLERAIDDSVQRGGFRSIPELLRWGSRELVAGKRLDARIDELYRATAARLRAVWEPDRLDELIRDYASKVGPDRLPWRVEAWKIETGMNREATRAIRQLADLERRIAASGPSVRAEARPMLEYLRALGSWYRSDPVAAHRRIGRVVDELDPKTHAFEVFRLLVYDVMLLSNRGRWAEAHRQIQRARRLWRQGHVGPERLIDTLRHAECHLGFREGHPAEGLARSERRIRTCRELGDTSFEGRALLQLAAFEYAVRLTDRARAHLRLAEGLYSRLDNMPYLAACRLLHGWTWLLDGNWEEAGRTLRDAERLAREVDWSTSRWAASVGLDLVRAETGDPEGARAHLRPPDRTAERSYAYRNEYYCARARILELSGDLGGARASLDRALAEARRTHAPRTDLIEAIAQRRRWEQAHGTPAAERVWRKRLTAVRAAWHDLPRPWKSFADAAARPLELPRPTFPELDRSGHLGATASLPTRILWFLGGPSAPAGDRPETPLRIGYTEQEIARGLGEERSRFSRALGRLRESGLIDRTVVRPKESPRRIFAYRLTRKGSESLETAVRPSDSPAGESGAPRRDGFPAAGPTVDRRT